MAVAGWGVVVAGQDLAAVVFPVGQALVVRVEEEVPPAGAAV